MTTLTAKDKIDYISGKRLYAVGLGFEIAAALCVLLFLAFEYIEESYVPGGFEYVNAKVNNSSVVKDGENYKASFSYEFTAPRYYLFNSTREKSFESQEEARLWLSDYKVGSDMRVSYNTFLPEYSYTGNLSRKPNVVNYIAPIGFVVFGIIGIFICRDAGRIVRNNKKSKE